MSLATKTPGAKRAGPEEYCFDLATIAHVHGGPDYTTATGPCIEGERMIVALMRMPAGTGAAPHSHPNEQWIYIVEGNFHATIGGKEFEALPGTVLYIPANVVHSVTRGHGPTNYSSPRKMLRMVCRGPKPEVARLFRPMPRHDGYFLRLTALG
jgi:quercetin dioxygenase-like cupin family protein